MDTAQRFNEGTVEEEVVSRGKKDLEGRDSKKKKVKVNGEGSDAGWRQAGRQGLYYNGTNIRPITATNAPTSARLEKREGQGPENGRERALWYDESSY